MSKLAVGLPTGLTAGINTPLGYFWKLTRTYALRPEIVVCGAVVLIMLFYVQALDVWSRTLFGKLQYTLGKTSSKVKQLYSHHMNYLLIINLMKLIRCQSCNFW